MARTPTPGNAARARRRGQAVARGAAALLPEQPGLPRCGEATGHGDGRAVRQAPGAGDVARGQRVRMPRSRMLVRRLGGSVRAWLRDRYVSLDELNAAW